MQRTDVLQFEDKRNPYLRIKILFTVYCNCSTPRAECEQFLLIETIFLISPSEITITITILVNCLTKYIN